MSKNTKDPWVRIIDVSNPVLHKKGYTLYKVTSKVFPKNSVEAVTEVTVWKRYNDFKKLHKALSTIHQNLHLKGTFPAFAKARLFGRFDDSVIEERRQSALQLLQFAASYPPLFTSQVFVKFFEDGYKIESSEHKKKIEEKTEVNILQPSRCFQKSDVLLSSFSDSKTKSLETNCKDSNNSLGGTWQHHQVPDNISLGSHCTDDGDDDDDHTTFTDDDSTISRPSFNLFEFDPLLESKDDGSEQAKSPLTVDNVCNNWLLSALESCSTSNTEKDVEGMLEFPTPFDDFENIDEAVIPSNKSTSSFNLNSGSGNNPHFTFDTPVSASVETCDVMEFDHLVSQEYNIEAENDVCNSDEFAMTPDAYKSEAAHRPSYIIDASKYVLHAQEAEESGKYHEAFDSYKKAIDVLLQGIKKEPCSDLRDAVRKKVYLYLMRAEEIYENKLPKSVNSTESKVPSPLSESPTLTVTSLKGSVQDLSKYKVLGILGKVLLVLDISNNCTYVVKTLYKSSSPRNMNNCHIIPQNVPFMVKIFQIYETNYALFLVLEHATGGRLWDYVSSYLQRSPLSPYNEDTYLYMEPRYKTDLCNVYSGKKISDGSSAENADVVKSVDSDLVASKTSPSSYVALFKKYAVTSDKEEKVALAKYRRYPPMPCNEKSHLKKYLDNEKSFHDSRTICVSSDADNSDKNETNVQNKKNHQQQRNSRNRLSSSTGSLEIALSQKTCHLEAFDAMDEAVFKASSKPIHLPESCIYLWAAEIVVALDSLHKLGIIWMDFQPDNILLGTEGHILLTYQGYWNDVDFVVNEISQENFFCAPEVGNIFPVTSDCDWWSLGVILYELLTGRSLVSCHPTGITMHTILNFPPDVSPDAKDFVSKLLQYNSTERLGSGAYGIEEIKCHPFFRFVDWESLYQT